MDEPQVEELRERLRAALFAVVRGTPLHHVADRLTDAVLDVLNPKPRDHVIDVMADAIAGCQSGYYSYTHPREAAVAALEALVEEGVFTLSTPDRLQADDDDSDAALLAKAQHDLAQCLVALDSAQDALWTVTQEGDRYRWGRPEYDMTWDHVWECADVALKDVRAAWSSLAASTKENEDG